MSERNEKKKSPIGPSIREQRHMLCENLSFSAAEAYKLLRTNLMYSLSNENACRMIGVTSSIRNEGKTTTSTNLAYTLAETGGKVLLIDGDMRLPSIAKRLALNGKLGLSGVLAGLYNEEKAIQASGILPNLMIMASGDIPPNPAELLNSERMRSLIERLKNQFDFVVIDLPPVNIVTDALIVSGLVDGMIVVVRQDYSDENELGACINSLKLVNAHLLGFVLTDTREDGDNYSRYRYRYGRRYGRYGKYRQYGKKYGYGYKKYGYGYAAAKSEETETSGQTAEVTAEK